MLFKSINYQKLWIYFKQGYGTINKNVSVRTKKKIGTFFSYKNLVRHVISRKIHQMIMQRRVYVCLHAAFVGLFGLKKYQVKVVLYETYPTKLCHLYILFVFFIIIVQHQNLFISVHPQLSLFHSFLRAHLMYTIYKRVVIKYWFCFICKIKHDSYLIIIRCVNITRHSEVRYLHYKILSNKTVSRS